ncbi:MAG: hypothetical protein AAF191_08820, partial [Verrucomicrobiota bacterium]
SIRILGNEAAMIFDEDYRYRDPNFIFGVELAELVFQFPLSRKTLEKALEEVGNLPLRNSYDRIFLYRCLALSRSPDPDLFVSHHHLQVEQRREIAERLERFLQDHVQGRRSSVVEKWSEAASLRLGVGLRAKEHHRDLDGEELGASCLYSLVAFLVAVKDFPPQEMNDLLAKCQSIRSLTKERREELLQGLLANPPMFFDFPNLDVASPLVPSFFGDLAELEAQRRPEDLMGLFAIREAAEYFRLDLRMLEDQMSVAYGRHFSGSLWEDSPETDIPQLLTYALILLLEKEEVPLFLYPKVGFEEVEAAALGVRLPTLSAKPNRWLVGTDHRLLALEVDESLPIEDPGRHRILWHLAQGQISQGGVAFDFQKKLVRSRCTIQGGHWRGRPESGTTPEPGLIVTSDMKPKEGFFQPLRRWEAVMREGP